MKRLALILVALVALIPVLCMPASAAETHTDHCVCGGAAAGVGDHTQCADITWTPLSQALDGVGLTMSTADFSKLPSGNYYLDGDVTVTGSGYIGSKSNNLATEPTKIINMNLCLNGHSITRSEGRTFGYLHNSSCLSICDCSYDGESFAGSVNGGTINYGSVVYTYSKSTLNIYGGNYTGKGTAAGGTVTVACDGCGDVNGDGKYTDADRYLASSSSMNLYNGYITGSTVTGTGSTIQLYHTAKLFMHGGTVVGGTAGGANSTIAFGSTCTANLSGGRVIGGTNKNGKELVQVIGNDGTLLGTYTSFADGLAEAQDQADRYLRLINDVTASDTVSGTLYLDLNGFTLEGISITGTLYGLDTTTNSYDGSHAGKLIPASGKPALQSNVAGRRYLALEQDGWSFHRFYVGITKMTLKPSTLGMGYKATFAGTQQVKEALSTATAYGYSMWLEEDHKLLRGYAADRFGGVQEVTLRIDNFLDESATAEENRQRGSLPVHACAYLRLADGTMLESNVVSASFQDMLEKADISFDSYSDTQQQALSSLSAEFSEAMMGWDIANTHHTEGSIWEAVDTDTFKAKLTKRSTNYYNIAGGHYVLTEDMDLGAYRLRVNAGTTVSICLNGHTITTSNRFVEQYGNLNICDCHVDAQEGGIISTQAGTSATYASIGYCRYNSVTNIYGGQLQATGKVNSAGLFAVSHDGSDKNNPAAVMNIYGGSLSGGQVYDNGGLISVWNKATLNIYGGEFFGGTADKRGGGIDINNGTLNISGGKIYGNTAGTVGGGISMTTTYTTVNISGGEISGNTATSTGSGIHASGVALTLSGAPIITGNNGQNLYNAGVGSLDIEELTENAQVGFYTSCTIVLSDKEVPAAGLTSDNENYRVCNAYGKTLLMAVDMTPAETVSGFNVGFGEVCIDPENIDGIPLAGYSNPTERLAVAEKNRKEYDKIMAQSVAITDESGQTVIMIFCDLIRADASFINTLVPSISAATGVPESQIYINVSHSHSVPSVTTTSVQAIVDYNATLPDLFARSALQAMHDRQPATMETGSFEVQQTVNGKTQYYNFYRHYSYEEDGIVKYFGDQFGTAVYDETTKPIRDADHTMHLVRFTREGKDILMSNWRIHPHFTGGESKYLLSADAIGTIRYYMGQLLPDTHFIYFQGAAGNVNETSRLTSSRVQASQVQNHGLGYVAYGEAVATCIVNNLGCLENKQTGLLQIDHYDYLAKADNPTDEEYANAKEIYDVFKVETAGMTLSQQNAWVRAYCAENPQYNYVSAFQLSFIVNRRYSQKDTVLPLNVVMLGDSFAFYTAPGEMWDSISMEVEDRTDVDTVFCLGYSMDHQHYFVYYPEYADMEDGVPYVSYESENRHFVAPTTVQEMIEYWATTINEMSEN